MWLSQKPQAQWTGMLSGTTTLENWHVLIVIQQTPFLGMCMGTKHLCPQKSTCTRMFIAALFLSAKTWKQCKYLSAREWINKFILSSAVQ